MCEGKHVLGKGKTCNPEASTQTNSNKPMSKI